MSPSGAIAVSTYDELQRFVRAFAAGHLNLLMLIGPGGVGKSQTVRQAVGEGACWIEGNASAFGIYTKLYQHKDSLVVIDDVDSLYSDRAAIRLLKTLCQTDPTKRVAWETNAVGKDGIPKEFVTMSRVIIIANEWKTLSRDVAAVQDRGHLVAFEPTPTEVHRKVGEWFKDEAIYRWFGEHIHLIPNHSMRLYVRALELQRAGINWVQHLLSEIPPKARLVAELRADPSFESEAARVHAFVERGGGSRATYFNQKRKLRAA